MNAAQRAARRTTYSTGGYSTNRRGLTNQDTGRLSQNGRNITRETQYRNVRRAIRQDDIARLRAGGTGNGPVEYISLREAERRGLVLTVG